MGRRGAASEPSLTACACEWRVPLQATAALMPHVLAWPIFKQLSEREQRELAQFLPECDREPSMWEAALRSEQLAEGGAGAALERGPSEPWVRSPFALWW